MESVFDSKNYPLLLDMDQTLGHLVRRDLITSIFDWINPNKVCLKVHDVDYVFMLRKDLEQLREHPFSILTANTYEVANKVAQKLVELGYKVLEVFVDKDIYKSLSTGLEILKTRSFLIEDCEVLLERKLETIPAGSKGMLIEKSTNLGNNSNKPTLEEALDAYQHLSRFNKISKPWERVRI
jgi:hypothetical protein